jgi:hypothetical protein
MVFSFDLVFSPSIRSQPLSPGELINLNGDDRTLFNTTDLLCDPLIAGEPGYCWPGYVIPLNPSHCTAHYVLEANQAHSNQFPS